MKVIMSKNCEVSSVVFHVDDVVAAANKTLARKEESHRKDVGIFADEFISQLHKKNAGILRRLGIMKRVNIPTCEEVINALDLIYAPGNSHGSVFKNSPGDRVSLGCQLGIYIDYWENDMALSYMYSDYFSSDSVITIRRLASLRADTLADTKVTLSISDAARIGLI